MGKLVPFEKRVRATASAPTGNSQPGQVVIFTGVRYERTVAPLPGKPPATGSKRKRV